MAFRVVQDEKNSLTVVTEPGDVRLSFFGGLEMGRVGVPELTEDGLVLVASSLDLLGTKLKVIMQRAESKDYSDIAQLVAQWAEPDPRAWGSPVIVRSRLRTGRMPSRLDVF